MRWQPPSASICQKGETNERQYTEQNTAKFPAFYQKGGTDMSVCCCSFAGTSACRYCSNNPMAERPPVVRTYTISATDKLLITWKRTNADRIRSMTDEELASFLNEGCPGYIKEEICQRHKSCPECWLEWLKQDSETIVKGAE